MHLIKAPTIASHSALSESTALLSNTLFPFRTTLKESFKILPGNFLPLRFLDLAYQALLI